MTAAHPSVEWGYGLSTARYAAEKDAPRKARRWGTSSCCFSCSRLKVAFVEIRCSPQAAACRCRVAYRSLVEQAVESHVSNTRNVGHPSERRFYSYGSTIANGATSARRSVECTKDAVPKCFPEAMKGLPIKQHSFMLVWIASSFLCVVCNCLLAKGRVAL